MTWQNLSAHIQEVGRNLDTLAQKAQIAEVAMTKAQKLIAKQSAEVQTLLDNLRAKAEEAGTGVTGQGFLTGAFFLGLVEQYAVWMVMKPTATTNIAMAGLKDLYNRWGGKHWGDIEKLAKNMVAQKRAGGSTGNPDLDAQLDLGKL